MIGKESYLYLIIEDEKLKEKELMYFYMDTWIQAKKEENCFGILTVAFDCMICRNNKLSEEILHLVIVEDIQESVGEDQIVTLAVSLI